MKLSIVIPLLLAPIVVTAFQVQVKTLFQFKDHTFLENIAIRTNGQLLLTSLTHPGVYSFDPQGTDSTPQPLLEFADATGISGITEVSPDVFAVISGVIHLETLMADKGSLCVWTLDLNGREPAAKKVVCVPDSINLNGITSLDYAPGVVLISASMSGSVYRVDLATGAFDVIIEDPLFAPTSSSPLGINGLHARGNTLYFANSAQGFFGLVPISLSGDQAGNVTKVVDAGPNHRYDDFALDKEGNAWIATHNNSVNVVTPAGEQVVVAGGGNSTEFSDPTSAAFGKGSREEERTLYVVTGGFTTTGGQVIALKIGK